MALSAKEAAEQVGMSRQGIMKAIHQGKISATKDLNGQWQIEPVELFRVYAPVSSTQPDATSSTQHTPQDATATDPLARENELLWKMIADKDDVIADLRARLDVEAEERHRLTLILTDSRSTPAPVVEKPKRIWQRLFG
jgi:excisionase family DNA binding protein